MTGKILVVEDDLNIQGLLNVFLSGQGYQVKVASDGQEALGLIGEFKPDLLITDVMMPRLNGYQLVHAVISERYDIPTPKIIILTSRTDPTDVQRGLTVGADMYIAKPFDMTEVAAHVSELLSKKEARKGQ